MSFNRLETSPPMAWINAQRLQDLRIPSAQAVTLVVDGIDQGDIGALQAALSDRTAWGMQGDVFLRTDVRSHAATIAALAACRPTGFLAAGCATAADIQALAMALRVAEADSGLPDGTFPILAEVGGALGFFVSGVDLTNVSRRLKGVVFNGDALTHVFPRGTADPNGAAHRHARAAAILTAAQAGLPSYDLLPGDLTDNADIRTRRDGSRADGFTAVIAANRPQLMALMA